VRSEAAAADRRQQVREAGRTWQRAGVVDERTRAAIDAAYPDDRARLGPVFRVLVFGFTVVAASAVFGLFALFVSDIGDRAAAVLLVSFGAVLVAATELQIGRLRRAEGGTEAATAFLAVSYLLAGLAWLAFQARHRHGLHWIDVTLVLVLLLCGAAAYRWGYALFAVAAAAAVFLLAARGPFGRVLWIAGAVLLAPALLHAAESHALVPAHRRASRAIAAVALVFLYLAVHFGSWDRRIVEVIGGGAGERGRDSGALLILSGLATALVPLLTLAWGIRTRRRLLIGLGVLGLLASLVTLRFYVHVAPLWLVLLAGGAFALLLASALRRYLESGPGRERGGLTAEPLFGGADGRSVLELAVNVATAAPEAQTPGAPELQPGGARYGGGGASGKY
jgi:hypothetical protein